MAFGKEIKRLRTLHHVSAQLLADAIGIDSERLRSWEKKDFNPREEDTILIEKYFGIPIDQLCKADKLPKVPTKEEVEKTKSFREQLRDKKLNGTKEGIPIYEDTPYTLGNVESYRDTPTEKADFWVTIPGLRHCNYGVRATGDSMHPLIRNHALVVGEEITDFSFIPSGDIYIIRAKNGVETIKYIHPHESDPKKFILVPYNKEANTTPILKKDILKIWKAKAVFNVL